MKTNKIYICKDNRVRAYCTDDDNKVHVISYPRLLMEEKIGRLLEPYEDVHHIDGNPLNNAIENLEIKLHGAHQQEHSKKYVSQTTKCFYCGKEFLWTDKKQRNFYSNISRKNNTRNSVGPFCSKECVGKYSMQKNSKKSQKNKFLLDIFEQKE